MDGFDAASALALSPAGERLAVVREPDSATPNTKPVSELVLTKPDVADPDGPSIRVEGPVESLTFTPNGELVLAGTDTGSVVVWDGTPGQAMVTAVAAGEVVNRIAVAPDGITVATGSTDTEAESIDPSPLRLWQLDGHERVVKARSIPLLRLSSWPLRPMDPALSREAPIR